MRERQNHLDEFNVRLIAVASRESYQARRLAADGIGVDLYLDPDNHFRNALGEVGRFAAWRLLDPRGIVPYLRAARHAKRFDPVWSETTRRPGLVLLDDDLGVAWSRFGNRLGDYPRADEVIAALDAVLAP